MKIVLDVSAAFAIITNANGSQNFLDVISQATVVLAPDLFYSEAANVGWKYHQLEDISPEEALRLSETAIQLIDIFFPAEPIWKDALQLGCELGHPVYDCFYLVLTQKQEATLLTKDKKLMKMAKRIDIPVLEL